MDANLFVDNIIILRKSLNISQPQLAKVLNKSTATISKWERRILNTMPDNKAAEIYEKLKKVSNFPLAVSLEMFLKNNLNGILRLSEKEKSILYDKHQELHVGLVEFLNDVRMRTLCRPTPEEIMGMAKITLNKQAHWADKYFFEDVLYRIRSTGKL